jgi:hypothetical protein
MAAGLGFKNFSSGEVLTAADVNGYLMQGVGVFTDAANRDAEITSPQEGQFAYLKDTNVTTYYTGSAWANLDTTGMTNPMTTTGDTIYSSSGSTPARLGIGSTGQVLTVAGGIPSWATPSAGGTTFSGASVYKNSAQGTSTATHTKLTFDVEEYDTDSYHDNSTNTERFTIPSGKTGYYQLTGFATFAQNSSGNYRIISIYKNNSQFKSNNLYPNLAPGFKILLTVTVYATAGDYFELVSYQDSGGSLNVQANSQDTWFQITYLGA